MGKAFGIGKKFAEGCSPAERAVKLLKEVETKLSTMVKVIKNQHLYKEVYACDVTKYEERVKEKESILNGYLNRIRVDMETLRTSFRFRPRFDMNPLANMDSFAMRIKNLQGEFEEQFKNKLDLAAKLIRKETPRG